LHCRRGVGFVLVLQRQSAFAGQTSLSSLARRASVDWGCIWVYDPFYGPSSYHRLCRWLVTSKSCWKRSHVARAATCRTDKLGLSILVMRVDSQPSSCKGSLPPGVKKGPSSGRTGGMLKAITNGDRINGADSAKVNRSSLDVMSRHGPYRTTGSIQNSDFERHGALSHA